MPYLFIHLGGFFNGCGFLIATLQCGMRRGRLVYRPTIYTACFSKLIPFFFTYPKPILSVRVLLELRQIFRKTEIVESTGRNVRILLENINSGFKMMT